MSGESDSGPKRSELWFYTNSEGEATGPVALEELQRLFSAGSINAATYVIEEGGTQWRGCEEVLKGQLPPPLPKSAAPRQSGGGFGQRWRDAMAEAKASREASIARRRPSATMQLAKLESAKSGAEHSGRPNAIREYRRTCRVCGKVWHSLVKREGQIERDTALNACQGCNAACNPGAQLQANRNIAANKSEISRLRECPNCKSTNYTEEIVEHDQPPPL